MFGADKQETVSRLLCRVSAIVAVTALLSSASADLFALRKG